MPNTSKDDLIAAALDAGVEFENLEFREGDTGIGGYVINPSEEAHIFVPERLMLPLKKVDMGTGKLIDGHGLSKQIEELWNLFLGFRFSSAAIETARSFLAFSSIENVDWARLGLTGFGDPEIDDVQVRRKIGQAYAIGYLSASDGIQKASFMPLMDWLNHSNTGSIFLNKNSSRPDKPGLSVTGSAVDGQLFVNYGSESYDPLHFLDTYQFAIKTGLARSLPMTINLSAERLLHVRRQPGLGTADKKFGRIPLMKSNDDHINCSFVNLSTNGDWKIAKSQFMQSVKRSSSMVPNDTWDYIRHYNLQWLWQTYAALEKANTSEPRELLIKSVRYQLDAILGA